MLNYGCKTKVQHKYNSQGRTERNIMPFAKEERCFWAAADWIWEIHHLVAFLRSFSPFPAKTSAVVNIVVRNTIFRKAPPSVVSSYVT